VQKKPPLSIYIHLPWCVHKCPYCDFNSHEKNNNSFELDKENYLAAITKHIQLHESDEREITSIFFGGGHQVYLRLVKLIKFY
jgi:coproporphyrinogen III oxidase-like Fe-S oxidoreductase